MTYTPQVRGYGVIVDLSKVAQADADILTAEAAAKQSDAALKRAQALFGDTKSAHAISLEALEAAEHQAEADKIQVALADRREVAAFGQNAPWRNADRDSEILKKLTTGQTVLVEATFPLGESFRLTPTTLSVSHLNLQSGNNGTIAKTLWDAPADPTIPGRSFYALLDGGDFAQGEHVIVFAPTAAAIKGVMVPTQAVVLSEDKAWCYVFETATRIVRISVELGQPVRGGYFIAHGIAPGSAVVTKGAGLLLAHELGPASSDQE